jgi:ferrochelatase
VLEKLASEGVKRLFVTCPGFSADCLETLEEIAIEGKAQFLNGGGEHFEYLGALNTDDAHIAALKDIVQARTKDWYTPDRETAELEHRMVRHGKFVREV